MWRLCLSDSGAFREECLGLPPSLFERQKETNRRVSPFPAQQGTAAAAPGDTKDATCQRGTSETPTAPTLPRAAPLLCLWCPRLFSKEAAALPPFAAAVGPASVPWSLLQQHQQQQQQQQQQQPAVHRVRLFGRGGTPVGPHELLVTLQELQQLLQLPEIACKQQQTPNSPSSSTPSGGDGETAAPPLRSLEVLWQPAAAVAAATAATEAGTAASKRQRTIGHVATASEAGHQRQQQQQQQQQEAHAAASRKAAILEMLPRVSFCSSNDRSSSSCTSNGGSSSSSRGREGTTPGGETGGGGEGGYCLLSMGSMLCNFLGILPCCSCLVALCALTGRLLKRR